MAISLKDTLIIDEIITRFQTEKQYGDSVKYGESGIAYITISVWDLSISRQVEDYVWKMPEFYGVESSWCDYTARCRPHVVYFVKN